MGRNLMVYLQIFKRMKYILAYSNEATIFTDHRKLFIMVQPTAVQPSLRWHKVLKMVQWALYLSSLSYTIDHVSGELNTIGDVMTRWRRGYRRPNKTNHRVVCLAYSTDHRMLPTAHDNIWLPVKSKYSKRTAIVFTAAIISQEVFRQFTTDQKYIWVPALADKLEIKLLTAVHAEQAAYRGVEASAATLRELSSWSRMQSDSKYFVSDFLLCITSRSGLRASNC